MQTTFSNVQVRACKVKLQDFAFFAQKTCLRKVEKKIGEETLAIVDFNSRLKSVDAIIKGR